jgi:hypothetical protein
MNSDCSLRRSRLGWNRVLLMQILGFLYVVIEDHDTLFVMSEGCHLAGLGILIYKLQQKQSAAGAARPSALPSVHFMYLDIAFTWLWYRLHARSGCLFMACDIWNMLQVFHFVRRSSQLYS